MSASSPNSGAAKHHTIPHVTALDGLRGVAVIAVLLFHAGHLQGGFLGVDLFFTLSGFLITSLLLVEHDRTGKISLRQFWARRARRLLPAMLAVVVVATLIAWWLLRDDELDRFAVLAASTVGYVANWAEVSRSRDYWALFDTPTPLAHMWSLAIEEQFYVLWPLLVAAAARVLGGRRGVRALVGLGLAGSVIATSVVLQASDGITRAYFGTDTRAASILIGAGLATVTAGVSRRESSGERALTVFSVPVALALVLSWTVVDGTEEGLYRWGLVAHALGTALLVAVVAGPTPGALGRLLTTRLLVRAGVLSYGLYLWHWPLYVVLDETRTGLDGVALTGVRLAASTLTAVVSYHLLEQPIRSQQLRIPRPVLVTTGAMAATLALIVAVSWSPGADDDRPVDVAGGTILPAAPASTDGSVLLLGDSGAATISDELVTAGREAGIEVLPHAQVGCGLVGAGTGVRAGDGSFFADPDGCDEWPERWRALIDEHDPDAVLLVLAWGGGGDRDLGDGIGRGPCDPVYDAYYEEQLVRAVSILGARGATVVVSTVPPHGFDRSNDARTACLNELYASVAERPIVELLDLASWTCTVAACEGGPDALRPDGVHFDGEGAARAAAWIIDETGRLTGLDGVPFAMFVGDSQALRLVEHVPSIEETGLRVGSLAVLGCGLSSQTVVVDDRETGKDQCIEPLAALGGTLESLDPDMVVVHAGVWEALDQVVGGERIPFADPRWTENLRAAIAPTLEELTAAHRLVVMTTPCFAEGPGRDTFGVADLDARIAAVNALLVEEAARLGAEVVDYAGYLCPGGSPQLEIDGTVLRPDGVHADADGARVVWSWLADELVELGRAL